MSRLQSLLVHRMLIASILLTGKILVAQVTDCPAPVGMPPHGEGWVALFDGDPEDLDDWREALDEPEGAWKVIDGVMIHEDTSEGNHIYYEGPEGPWSDFELVCEFRTEIGTNSGVYFRCNFHEHGFPQSPWDLEAQINNTSNFAVTNRTGGLVPLGGESVSPVVDNQWTHMRIKVVNDYVTIETNGEVTTSRAIPTDEYTEPEGTICLQGEGLGNNYDRVEFRNVYIRHLPVSGCDGWDQGSPSPKTHIPQGVSKSPEGLSSGVLDVVAHYHFDGNFSNSIDNLYHMKPFGSATLSSNNLDWMICPAQGSQAVCFEGRGDSIVAVYDDAVIQPDGGQRFTIEGLFYVSHVKELGDPGIPLLTFRGVNQYFRLEQTKWSQSPIVRYREVEVGDQAQLGAAWTLNEWMHLKFVYDIEGEDSKLQCYLNAAKVAEGPIEIDSDQPYHWFLEVGNFEGNVDELRVTREALIDGASGPITLANWRARSFPADILNDASKEASHWGDEADMDADGFNTIAEYYLGLNPLRADGADAFQISSCSPLQIEFLHSAEATGLTASILGSDTPGGWQVESFSNPTVTKHGRLAERIRVDIVGAINTETRRFFSLGVNPDPQ